jgi:hypothetical protein
LIAKDKINKISADYKSKHVFYEERINGSLRMTLEKDDKRNKVKRIANEYLGLYIFSILLFQIKMLLQYG